MPKSEVFCADCLPALSAMPDNAFNLAIVDPPYGIGVMSMNYTTSGAVRNHGYTAAKRRDYRKQGEWDTKPPREYFTELLRVCQKTVIWGGGNYFADYLPASKSFVVWDKRVTDQMRNDFSDCEYAWLSPGMGVARMFRYTWNGMIQGNMKNKEDRWHPTQKPIALYEWILKNYAKPGDTILDTHMGSQSSRIAAWNLGFDYTGYEIDPEYFEKGCARFERHTAQMNLFLEET